MRENPEIIKLDCGVSLVVVPEPSAPAVAMSVGIRIGRAEEHSQPGVASLLMRTLGADSEGRSTALLRRDIEAFGALGTEYEGNVLTAWTVCGVGEAAFADATQTLLFNLLGQPRFSEENLEQARAAQIRALSLAEDGLVPRLVQATRARAFGSEASLYGDASALKTVTVESLRTFYERHCRPDRTTISVVGKITPEAARRHIEANLGAGGFAERGPGPKETLVVPDPIPRGLRPRVITEDQVTALAIGYLAPGLSSATAQTDWPALRLLDAVIGGGKASRLFRLRDERALAYELRTQLAPGRDASFWIAYLLGDTPTSESVTALLALTEQLATAKAPVTEAELERARAFLKGRYLADRQLVLRRARAVAWTVAMGLPVEVETTWPKTLESVQLGDVNRVAAQVLGGNPAIVRTEK